MEKRTRVWIGLGLIVLAVAAVLAVQFARPPGESAGPVPAGGTLAPGTALEAVTATAQGALDALDARTAEAARALGPTGMAGEEARRILRELARASPAAIDATAVSKDGIMLTVEPAAYASAEGADISGQEHVAHLLATHEPVMSRVFLTVEGINATDIEHPVFTPSGAFNGSASLLFDPGLLLADAVEEALAGRTAEVFVVDTDGIVLYDRDPAEIGTNTFTDPMYAANPELQALARRMQTEPEGTGAYTFVAEGSATPVRKEVAWDSVGLYGTAWRVVAATVTPPA